MGMSPDEPQQTKNLRAGTWAAFGCYWMWGLLPVYWKQIAYIDSTQILCHRVIWSALFLFICLSVRGWTKQLIPIFCSWKNFISVAVCALFITGGWGLFIWAVNSGHITDSSMGYYIAPLMSVVLGNVFFKEKMDKWTVTAVVIAAMGIILATAMIGKIPWIAVLLAAFSAIYSVVKKKAGFGALAGITAETLLATPFALIWLLWSHSSGTASFFGPDSHSAFFLIVAGPATAIPLVTFAFAANRVPLQKIGFMQYLAPTLQLAIGLLIYRESIPPPMMMAIGTVIVSVIIYMGTRETRWLHWKT